MINKFVHAGIVNPEELSTIEQCAQSAGIDIVYLDGSFVLPSSDQDIHKNYQSKRLPGALFFDITSIADKSSTLPHMIPDAEGFSQAVSRLGIKNTDLIVVYGQHGLVMGPARVWWMFKGFGHPNVIVLNGGLPAYEQAGLPLETNTPNTPEPSIYKASLFNDSMVIQMDQMLDTVRNKSGHILDARPANRFSGESPEPRENMRSGHMPGALNAPSSTLVDENGKLKSAEDLQKLFADAGVTPEPDQNIITTCGSGITACALSLALYHLGHHKTAVYDGSWSEWGLGDSNTPIEKST
ncbi:MAG: sulfurtransferase [Alcanivorax sp.]